MMEESWKGDSGHASAGFFARVLDAIGQIDAVENTDSFAHFEHAPRLVRFLPVSVREFSHYRWLRQQYGWDDFLPRAPADGFLADRKRLEQRRMRPLVG